MKHFILPLALVCFSIGLISVATEDRQLALETQAARLADPSGRSDTTYQDFCLVLDNRTAKWTITRTRLPDYYRDRQLHNLLMNRIRDVSRLSTCPSCLEIQNEALLIRCQVELVTP